MIAGLSVVVASVATAGCSAEAKKEQVDPSSWCDAAAIDAPTASDPPFPLTVDSERGILLDAGGAPFLVHGDAAWSLIAQLDDEDVATYLDDRADRGFNTILVNLVEHRFATNAPADISGRQPFASPGDFSAPVDEYFARAEWVVEQAAERGMVVLLDPLYGGVDPSQGWYAEMEEAGPDVLREYGRYVGERFEDHPNIIWVESGDLTPPDLSLVDAVAEGIDDADPDAMQTAHAYPETAAADVWGDRDWLDLNNVYSYADVQGESLDQYRAGARPFIMIESTYENEIIVSAEQLRSNAYVALLAGATGHVFGNNPIWHFDGPGLNPWVIGWKDALDSPGARSMESLKTIWDTLPWWRLQPDLDGAFVPTEQARDGTLAAAVTCERDLGVIYVAGGWTPLTVDLSALAGSTATIRWLDPWTGSDVSSTTAGVADGVVELTNPGINASGATDWIVVIETA